MRWWWGAEGVKAVGVEHYFSHSQWLDQLKPDGCDGLHKLLFAVFEQALRDYFEPRYRDDVRSWIDERNGFGPFAFDSACDSLDFDRDWMRAGFRRFMGLVDLRARLGRVSRDGRRSRAPIQ